MAEEEKYGIGDTIRRFGRETVVPIAKQLAGDVGATAMDVGNAVTFRGLWGDQQKMDAERSQWLSEMGAMEARGPEMDAARATVRFGAPAVIGAPVKAVQLAGRTASGIGAAANKAGNVLADATKINLTPGPVTPIVRSQVGGTGIRDAGQRITGASREFFPKAVQEANIGRLVGGEAAGGGSVAGSFPTGGFPAGPGGAGIMDKVAAVLKTNAPYVPVAAAAGYGAVSGEPKVPSPAAPAPSGSATLSRAEITPPSGINTKPSNEFQPKTESWAPVKTDWSDGNTSYGIGKEPAPVANPREYMQDGKARIAPESSVPSLEKDLRSLIDSMDPRTMTEGKRNKVAMMQNLLNSQVAGEKAKLGIEQHKAQFGESMDFRKTQHAENLAERKAARGIQENQFALNLEEIKSRRADKRLTDEENLFNRRLKLISTNPANKDDYNESRGMLMIMAQEGIDTVPASLRPYAKRQLNEYKRGVDAMYAKETKGKGKPLTEDDYKKPELLRKFMATKYKMVE